MRFMLKHFSLEAFCRLSFCDALWEPKGMMVNGTKSGADAYSSAFLLPKTHPQVEELQKIMIAVAQEKWGDKIVKFKGENMPNWQAVLLRLKAENRLCLKDGDDKTYDGYAGNFYISSRNSRKPLVVGFDPFIRDPETGEAVVDPVTKTAIPNLVTQQSGIVYGGCYVNASLDIYAQDNQYGQRINASLRGVQFAANGDAFAAGPPASASEFEVPDLSVGAQQAVEAVRSTAAAARDGGVEATMAQGRFAAVAAATPAAKEPAPKGSAFSLL
jgi:Protein of unknown function (DUF2815)